MKFLNAGDSHASPSHESSLEPTPGRSAYLGKHSVYTLPERPKLRDLPEYQNYKSPVQKRHWRSRTSSWQLWWFDCSISQSSQWRLWISKQSSICSRGAVLGHPKDPVVSVQNKNFAGNTKELAKVLDPNGKPKVNYTDNSFELGKACEDLSWNRCTSTAHRLETNGIAERAVRRVKEGTSAVLLQSGLDENWWADSVECYTYLRNIQDLLSDGKTPYERRFGEPFKGPIIPFGSLVEYHPQTAKDQSRIHQFGKKVLPGLFLGYALYAGGIWKGDMMVADLEELETMDASEIYSSKTLCEGSHISKRKWKVHFFQSQMDESNSPEEIRNWEHPSWYGITQFEEKVEGIFLENQRVCSSTTSRLTSGCRWSD